MEKRHALSVMENRAYLRERERERKPVSDEKVENKKRDGAPSSFLPWRQQLCIKRPRIALKSTINRSYKRVDPFFSALIKKSLNLSLLTKVHCENKHLSLRREPAKAYRAALKEREKPETAVCGDHRGHDDEDYDDLEVRPPVSSLQDRPGEGPEDAGCRGQSADEDEGRRLHVERRFPKQDGRRSDGRETCKKDPS